jgi:tryptophanyl-tRNA synthetase
MEASVAVSEEAPRAIRRVMSGSRPTGRQHLGHLVGALTQWAALSRAFDAYFEIADLHALTTRYEHPEAIEHDTIEMVLDWLAAGVDPRRSTIYRQSGIPQISELNVLLSMITPVSWLQRVPTYKDQIEALGPDIASYGFFGYPLLQLCDIAIVKADTVPVGRDQMSHLEFGREVVRRFNHLYGETLIEPHGTLSEFPDVPGTDNRKMSKSYGNAIDIADGEDLTRDKVRKMFTDPQKLRKGDPGRPEVCPVFSLHKLANANRAPWIDDRCSTGELGCVACKSELTDALNAYLAPIRARRREIARADVEQIVAAGTSKVYELAAETIAAVKRAMKIG